MLYIPILVNTLEVVLFIIPILLVVAFVTVAERKTMASMQRRLGPNIVGYYGLLQAFADALKLLLKEYVSPTQANMLLFFLGPIITLVFSLLGYAVIPYAPGLTIFDFNLGVLYMLAVSSLATYGILLAGWSANSKYAFLGSVRSTAQLISYELILSSGVFLVVLITSSLSLTVNIEIQKCVWLFIPLFPIFIVFFISAVAETNRAPFDLAEAESELVSGFMTEHSAVIFVFFFLAEYASIVLICIFMCLLFFGGYNVNSYLILDIINLFNIFYLIISQLLAILLDMLILVLFVTYTTLFYFDYSIGLSGWTNYTIQFFMDKQLSDLDNWIENSIYNYEQFNAEKLLNNPIIENTIYGSIIAIKSFLLIFIFIWVRASLPRIRFDQLMSYCWTVMLPIAFAFIIFVPCLIYVLGIMPSTSLFF